MLVTKHSIKKQKIDTFFKKFDVKKDNYEYNDFDELKINWNENLFLTESIGQKIVIKNNYPFIANPYNNNIIDALLKREVQNIISTQNAYLLFKYFPIEDNNIYVCLAENVLNYAEKEKLDQQYFLKLYFPILFKTIKSKEQLLTEKVSLYNAEKTKDKKIL